MNKKFIKIVFISLVLSFFHLSVSALVLDLSSSKSDFPANFIEAEIYKPSKMVIGSTANFIVKAKPGTYVTIVFSEENTGSEPFYGKELQIGAIIDKLEGIVGKKGVIELILEIPDKKELAGTMVYFEAIAWKNKDFSDLSKAKIMNTSGRATTNNAILITEKIKNPSVPTFAPTMPGVGNVSDTMNAFSKKSEANAEFSQEMFYRNKDLMLRNLKAPELTEEQQANEEE